jgi:hypothetical protein
MSVTKVDEKNILVGCYTDALWADNFDFRVTMENIILINENVIH